MSDFQTAFSQDFS